ncbi:Rib/alpha-like domain-containing protein, partial [Enterococcus faecalis]|uniref:Rib/alpha-like domain-containing protein n=1 Tax=Enterococcus faecalis TaxID=1351 RepID=UPI0040438623
MVVKQGTTITENDITGKVSNVPAGTTLKVKDPSQIPSTEAAGDKGTVTVTVTYLDGSTEEVEVPIEVTPKTTAEVT